MKDINLRQPDLPPFLPAEILEEDFVGKSDGDIVKTEEATSNTDNHIWDPVKSFGTLSTAFRNIIEGRELQYLNLHHKRRLEVQEQLLAMQKASNSTLSSSRYELNLYGRWSLLGF